MSATSGWYHDYTGEGIYAGEDRPWHGVCRDHPRCGPRSRALRFYKVGDLVDLENAKDRSIQERS